MTCLKMNLRTMSVNRAPGISDTTVSHAAAGPLRAACRVLVEGAAAEGGVARGKAEVGRQALDGQVPGRDGGAGLENLQGGLQHRHQGRSDPGTAA